MLHAGQGSADLEREQRGLTDRRLWRFVMLHGAIAFAFNVLVLAIAVNGLATTLPGLVR